MTEEEVKQKFVEAFNSILEYKEEVIANVKLAQKMLGDFSKIDKEINGLNQELENIAELSRKTIYENAHMVIEPEEWNQKNESYLERHQKVTKKIAELQESKRERINKNYILDQFIKEVKISGSVLKEFDEDIWRSVAEKIVVQSDGGLEFWFKDGRKIDG